MGIVIAFPSNVLLSQKTAQCGHDNLYVTENLSGNHEVQLDYNVGFGHCKKEILESLCDLYSESAIHQVI